MFLCRRKPTSIELVCENIYFVSMLLLRLILGRSARAGRFGGAITFVTQHDELLLKVNILFPIEIGSSLQLYLHIYRMYTFMKYKFMKGYELL